MKLYDMHTHTKGISLCSRLDRKELCAAIKEDGTDGLILTNHYGRRHCRTEFSEWIKKYEEEYFLTKEEAESVGLSTLFGIEVTLGDRDFLLYGVTTSCLFESEKPLWDYTLPELCDFAHAHDALIVHAHPYRFGGTPADARYLDGVEINCHPLYLTNMKNEVIAYAKEHNLLLTCGSDYHGDIYKAHCGILLPDELHTEKELADYLRSGKAELVIHDIDPERANATVIH